MRVYSAAIFDMDGLLLDSERLALETFQSTCTEFETGDLSDLFNRLVGTNARLTKLALKEEFKGTPTNYLDFGRAWDEKYHRVTSNAPIPLKVGAVVLLKFLKSNNIPRAVATSTDTEQAIVKLNNSGILDYFDLVVGGEQVAESKPAPDIFLKAAAGLSIPPSDCLAFEDSNNGVRAAVAAGMTVIQIPDLVQPDDAVLELGPIILDTLGQVPDSGFFGNR